MTAQLTEPPFTVSVLAGFSEDGTWTIDAHLQFRDGHIPALGSRLLGEGRMALLKGIRREGLRGRWLGATRVHVRMDAGDGPVNLDSNGVIPVVGSTN